MGPFVIWLLLVAIISETGSGVFERYQNKTPYGFEVVSDPSSKTNQRVEKFELRSGDCATTEKLNDCDAGIERSELRASVKNGESWVAWSVYLPEDYKVVYPTQTTLGNFVQSDNISILSFVNGSGGYGIDHKVLGRPNALWQFLIDGEMRGKWTNVLVHANWTEKSDGFIRVYINGRSKPVYAYNGKTIAHDTEVFFNYGIARSKRAKSTGNIPTQIVYYDNVKIGKTCNETTDRFKCGVIAN